MLSASVDVYITRILTLSIIRLHILWNSNLKHRKAECLAQGHIITLWERGSPAILPPSPQGERGWLDRGEPGYRKDLIHHGSSSMLPRWWQPCSLSVSHAVVDRLYLNGHSDEPRSQHSQMLAKSSWGKYWKAKFRALAAMIKFVSYWVVEKWIKWVLKKNKRKPASVTEKRMASSS